MKLIDKDVLVAEIERRKKLVSDPILLGNDLMIGERNALFNLLSFIDTLEVVKEVEFEKEDLTWKDLREIYIIFAEIDAEIESCKTDIQGETIGYYQETLKRFKSIKGGIKL